MEFGQVRTSQIALLQSNSFTPRQMEQIFTYFIGLLCLFLKTVFSVIKSN